MLSRETTASFLWTVPLSRPVLRLREGDPVRWPSLRKGATLCKEFLRAPELGTGELGLDVKGARAEKGEATARTEKGKQRLLSPLHMPGDPGERH